MVSDTTRLFAEVCNRQNLTGTTPVLLHGLGSSTLDGQHQTSDFSRHFRLLAPDLRGLGNCRNHRDSIRIEQMANDMHQLLEQDSNNRQSLKAH